MIRLKHIISVFVIISFFVPALASAQAERLILKYADRNINTRNKQNQTIYLKRELQEKYPGLDISQYRLIKTVVMVKSKKGAARFSFA